MQHDPHRLRCVKRVRQRLGDPRRIGHRHAGVDAQDLDMRDRRQRRDDRGEPARRQHQRIAAGQDDLADRWMRGEPVVCRLQLGLGQQAAVRSDMLAAEAEAAIDRTDQQRLQQRPVGIAVHHALDRRQRVIRDRIGTLVRRGHQFRGIGDELPADRVVRVARSAPASPGRSQRRSVARPVPPRRPHREGSARPRRARGRDAGFGGPWRQEITPAATLS